MLLGDGKPFPRNPMNKNNTPSIPDIFEEIFAPFFAEELKQTFPTRYTTMYEGQVSADGSVYTLAFEVPRLVKDSITVTVEPTTSQYKTSAHKVVIKATQKPLQNYVEPNHDKQETIKPYQQDFILYSQQVALDGSLTLAYTEGVLCIQIPLTKPVQPKKASLSARLSDIAV